MKYYTGIDFHKQFSIVAEMDQHGNVMNEHKLYHTDKKEVVDYFSSLPEGTSVSIEATRNWYWLVDILQDLSLDVKLVHAKKARVIAESIIKTDKIDAKILAHLDRCNFLPQAYIANKNTRSARELLRYYMSLVKIRASIKNRIHAILAKNNIHQGFSDLFGKAGSIFLKELDLPQIYRSNLDGYLAVLEHLKQQILIAQKKIKDTCKNSAYTQRLITIPGISYFSALLIAAEIADIKRFRNYKKLCCYAGLVSSTHQSADKVYHGRLIKDSNKYLRYALIEAIPTAIRKDPELWSFYQKVSRIKGKNKAKIAVARKLLIAIYYMLKNNMDYKNNIKYRNFQVNPATKLGTLQVAP